MSEVKVFVDTILDAERNKSIFLRNLIQDFTSIGDVGIKKMSNYMNWLKFNHSIPFNYKK